MFDLNSVGLGMGIMFAILVIFVVVYCVYDFVKSVDELKRDMKALWRNAEYKSEDIQKILARLNKLEEESKND